MGLSSEREAAMGGIAENTGVGGDGLRIAFSFCTGSFPYLQAWHDFRPHACVLGIEPCMSAKTNDMRIMQPAQSRRYEVNVCFNLGQ